MTDCPCGLREGTHVELRVSVHAHQTPHPVNCGVHGEGRALLLAGGRLACGACVVALVDAVAADLPASLDGLPAPAPAPRWPEPSVARARMVADVCLACGAPWATKTAQGDRLLFTCKNGHEVRGLGRLK